MATYSCTPSVDVYGYGTQASLAFSCDISYNTSTHQVTVSSISYTKGGSMASSIDKGEAYIQYSTNNGSSYTNLKRILYIEDKGTYGDFYTYPGAINIPSNISQIRFRISCWVGYQGGDNSSTVYSSATSNYSVTCTMTYNANGHGTTTTSTANYGASITLKAYLSNATSGGTSTTGTITPSSAGTTGVSISGVTTGKATWTTAKTTWSQVGWNTNSAGTGTNYSSGASYTLTANTTLYAKWSTSTAAAAGTAYTLPGGTTPTKSSTTANSYTVAYNLNGGISTIPTTQTSTKTTSYTFKGWYTSSTGGTQRTTASRVTAAETVYPQFTASTAVQNAITLATTPTKSNTTANGYTVTFNANGGTTTLTSATAIATTTYTFNKWHLNSVTGTAYNAGTSFTPTANSTMYAAWTSSTTQSFISLPIASQCTNANKILIGWATTSAAITPTYSPGSQYTPTNNITLYAVWADNDINSIYINNVSAYAYIHNGTNWNKYTPYIYKNNEWIKYGKE